jgi:hypothetical protein
MQNGKSTKKDLPLLKNDITTFEPVSKIKIHSRNQKFDNKKSRAISDPALGDPGIG